MNTSCICGASLEGLPPVVTRTYSWGTSTFRHCSQCASYIQWPPLPPEQAAAWFSSPEYQGGNGVQGVAYRDYRADEDNRRKEARGRIERDLQRYLFPGARVLEIGCASGSVLSVLQEMGMSVVGIDLSENFARQAWELNRLRVQVGDFLAMEEGGEGFDVILMLGTISNMGSLSQQLEKVARLLKPGGLFFFNFPSAASFTARLYGKNYWMFTPSINSFMTEKGCLAALQRAGLHMERLATDRQRPSFAKLFHHAKMDVLLAPLRLMGQGDALIPVTLPIPGIRAVWARRRVGPSG